MCCSLVFTNNYSSWLKEIATVAADASEQKPHLALPCKDSSRFFEDRCLKWLVFQLATANQQ